MHLFLIAYVAGKGIAIDADQVDSVVDIGDVVAVPRVEAAVRGLAALRSRVVTVIDTGIALGLDPTPPTARRAVITQQDGHFYAILVDALDDIALFERQPLSTGLALRQGWARAGSGLVVRDGEPLLVLDLARLIPASTTPAAQAA